jgi:hypothetical protein
MSDKKFTVAGLTKHSAGSVTVEKVRFGTDLIRLIKMLNNPKKIYHKPSEQCLAPQRVDFVELPSPMSKEDACKFLAAHADFQSAADQALISETLGSKSPKSPRTPKTPKAPKVKATKKTALSLDSIKSRAKKQVTPEQIVAAALAAETTVQ